MKNAYREGTHRSASGIEFFYRQWPAADELRCRMLLLHGFNDHGGRYAPFAEELSQLGIEVTAPDLPGHGRTQGRRGHIPDIHACLTALERLQHALQPASEPSVVLYGHSYGALLAIRWLETRPHPFAKALIQSPYLKEGFPVPAHKVALGRRLAKLVPSLPFRVVLPLDSLCGDTSVVLAYTKDPLVHNKITAATYMEILRQQSAALDEASAIDIPVLMLSGAQDTVVDQNTNNAWFHKLKTEKQSLCLEGNRHECHNEKIRNRLLETIAAFVG